MYFWTGGDIEEVMLKRPDIYKGEGSTRIWTTLGTPTMHEERAPDLRLLSRDDYLLLHDAEGLI